jgi:hypothetical protein
MTQGMQIVAAMAWHQSGLILQVDGKSIYLGQIKSVEIREKLML